MRSQLAQRKGVEPVAGPQVLREENRSVVIAAKAFTSVEQATPLRVVYGRAEVGGVQITPIFGFRNEPITTKVGK